MRRTSNVVAGILLFRDDSL